ncbi:hypothetical protein QR674_00720 [Acinetobacter chinensis]|uniref:Uncharacterized protein n=1 Tax=Acinetobacter chinensis TaxID=2004650 RepID=A0ABU3WBS1_9GAMM|nr:hypothetical protein [Acinetobacter chinensis]MDV2467513.1 hypothetical protein [Acinetobacter chinensis]
MKGCSIILGKDENHPLLEIRAIEKDNIDNCIKLPRLENLKNFASVAFQAAPSLITQSTVAKSSIMEVVVNGSLVQAADGNGLRAFVQGADGKIIEHARLYNADTLSNIVNVGAVWQIASIIVAQKHLADISQKLDNLKDGIERIQDFQQTERKSSIFMISNRLKEKITVLMNSNNKKHNNFIDLGELNAYEDTLEKIYLHLKADLKNYGLKKTEHKEMFGTADYKNALERKIEEIQDYFEFAYYSLNLRSMNTSIIDYLGGNDDLVQYRTNGIKQEIKNLNSLITEVGENITKEVNELKSVINDAQSFVKNNKNNIAVGAVSLLAPVAIAATVVAGALTKNSVSKILFGEDKKSDLLGERKQEMLEKLNRSLISSNQKLEYSMGLVNTNLLQLINKEKPIKLLFQKIDDSHVLCLNNNEKIAI